MKITKRQLKQIIKEEKAKLNEGGWSKGPERLREIREGMLEALFQSIDAQASYDPEALGIIKSEIMMRGLDFRKEALAYLRELEGY